MSGSELGGSTSTPATGGATGTTTTGGATGTTTTGGASVLGRLRSGLPLPVHDHETPGTGGEIDYLRTAWGTAHEAAPDPHPGYATDGDLDAYLPSADAATTYQALAGKAQPNGYASLDATGVIPTSQLPPLAINDTFTVASEAAMLALPAQVGDMAIRTDTGLTYVLAAAPAATLANWKEVLAAGQVVSVNGHTGVVSLTATDVGALDEPTADAVYAGIDHTHPSQESSPWRFQDTVGGTPGAGYLRTNTGVLATASTLIISRTTQDGYDIPPPGWGVQADDTIYVQDRDDSTKWVRYTALEPLVRYPTYAAGLVAVTGHAGTIANGQIVQVTFSLAGGGGGGAGGGMASDALWDAKGDLAAGTGANAGARLAVGADGQVLTADSTQSLGVKWAAAAGGGGGLPTTGGTMTGTIASAGSAVDSGGALAVAGTIPAFEARVIGAASTFSPTPLAGGFGELGIRFHVGVASTLSLVRWWRQTAGSTAPSRVALWDDTAPATPVWTQASPSAFTDTATGWKSHAIAAGSRPSLVAGRSYTVSYTITATTLGQVTGYVPTPDTPVVFETHAATGTGGAFPADGTTNYGIDAGVTIPATAAPAAASGTVRLPAASGGGALAWRNAADTADLTLAPDSSGNLTWAGAALLTAALADGRYLRLAGGTLSGGVLLQGAFGSTRMLEAQLATGDSDRRWRIDMSGVIDWGGGTFAPDTSLQRSAGGTLRVVNTLVADTSLGAGTGTRAASGALRLQNTHAVAWRNAGNSADLSVAMDASDRLALAVGAGSLTSSASGGSATALPAQPVEYWTVVVNGNARKIAVYA